MAHSSKGEGSRKRDITEDEKPLKKARYVWEVKGKHHLKDTEKSLNNNTETPGTSTGYSKNHNIEPKNDNSSVDCCISSILERSEAVFNSIEEKLDIEANNNDVSVSLVPPVVKNQDYYINQWQQRQIARGFVDNTINSVLESFSIRPYNATDLIDDCENDEQVEDEGIMMAIQSHGLNSKNTRFGFNSESPHPQEITEEDCIQMSLSALGSEIIEGHMDNMQNNELERQLVDPSLNGGPVRPLEDKLDKKEEDFEDPVMFFNEAIDAAIRKKGLSLEY